MNILTLRWYLQNRSDGCMDEYATDKHGNKIYVIEECKDGGYILYDTRNILEEVWCFDTQEQARREAEIRYVAHE